MTALVNCKCKEIMCDQCFFAMGTLCSWDKTAAMLNYEKSHLKVVTN